jgi:RNA-directed DNA polymerase
MRRLIIGWKRLGHERRYAARIVNYADDMVICCARDAEEALAALRQLVARLKLTVNEHKTHICQLPQGRFDFLGYTFERCYSETTGRSFLGTRPSKKSIRRLMQAISAEAHVNRGLLDTEYVVGRLNRILAGWANYFCLGPVSKAYKAVDRHTALRLRWWLCKKHKVPKATARYSFDYLYETLGLISLRTKPRNRPWATASALVREPDAGNPPVRFDERGEETGSRNGLLGHRQPKGPATDKLISYHYRASLRLY